MQAATVVIPNLNGMQYLRACLDSLGEQSRQDFSVILIDNGSQDGSAEFVESHYPDVILRRFERNEGFCSAVNEGIRMAETPYVILLNNDTICAETFVEEMIAAIERTGAFSCAARMVQMQDPKRMDDAGDYYCALGWAYALGRGKPSQRYGRERPVFSACAGAAIYRREVFDEIGLFDEAYFAYLEDMDVAFRARIAGYRNFYAPGAVVRHVGSATSGSLYNDFKIRHSSRNSIYLIYKNMPWLQIALNAPFLLMGFVIKQIFFASKGFGKEYFMGLLRGAAMCRRNRKVKFRTKNLKNYARIQLELWLNLARRLTDL